MVDKDVAALMVTNPNTLGVFEENIIHVAEILHAKAPCSTWMAPI